MLQLLKIKLIIIDIVCTMFNVLSAGEPVYWWPSTDKFSRWNKVRWRLSEYWGWTASGIGILKWK